MTPESLHPLAESAAVAIVGLFILAVLIRASLPKDVENNEEE